MNGTVPVLSIVCMAVSLVIAFGVPIALLIYFRRKKGADILPFFIGCAVMFIFAFILEAYAHQAVFASEIGKKIQNNVFAYALYGGFMAGLFEETGRFLAFKTVLKNKLGKDANALMYGAGHGGFEAIYLLGITSINNIIYSVLINSGRTDMLTSSLTGDYLAQVNNAISLLKTTPSYLFLMGGVERIFAIVLQIALSVLVWFAAKKKNRLYLYPLAVLIHLLVDGITVICSGKGVSTITLEAIVCLMAVVTVIIAKTVWKKEAVQ